MVSRYHLNTFTMNRQKVEYGEVFSRFEYNTKEYMQQTTGFQLLVTISDVKECVYLELILAQSINEKE